MDSFEWNKVFAALLAVAFVLLGLNFLSDGLFSSKNPKVAGYEIEGGAVAATSSGPAEVEVESVNALLASATPEAGLKAAKKCTACHTMNEGGANKVGPGLYGIVNRAIASVDGFGYSGAYGGEESHAVYDIYNDPRPRIGARYGAALSYT